VSGERAPELSRRELEVLRGLATGATNAQIAVRMGISEHTVRNHVQSVMRKLAAASRTDAVATGLRRGLVDLPE
jgi:DNA-binding NarL/FixJ family response regulator